MGWKMKLTAFGRGLTTLPETNSSSLKIDQPSQKETNSLVQVIFTLIVLVKCTIDAHLNQPLVLGGRFEAIPNHPFSGAKFQGVVPSSPSYQYEAHPILKGPTQCRNVRHHHKTPG